MIEEILHEFECPVCQTYMHPPIRMCISGHSICEKCRNELTQCPICREWFSNVRNFALETIIEKLQVSCKYGCSTMKGCLEIQQHEEECPLRSDRKCFVLGCRFQGTWVEIKAHLTDHVFLSLPTPSLKQLKTMSSPKTDRVVSAFGEVFRFLVCKGDYYSFTVEYVGDKNSAKDFFYKLQFGKGHKNKTYSANCVPMYNSQEQGFLLDKEQLSSMCVDEWDLTVTVTKP